MISRRLKFTTWPEHFNGLQSQSRSKSIFIVEEERIIRVVLFFQYMLSERGFNEVIVDESRRMFLDSGAEEATGLAYVDHLEVATTK